MGDRSEEPSSLTNLPANLDTALRGRLPCIVCGYDLQGLSVRGKCPECGTAVRAAILYQVDPRAEEFSPVRAPMFTGWCLILWPLGGLMAIIAGWAMRIADLVSVQSHLRIGIGWGGAVIAAGVVMSAIGAVGLINPTRATRRWWVVTALLGLACYAPIYLALERIVRIDADGVVPYFESGVVWSRTVARMVVDIALIGVLLGLRPNARELVRRSLAMRTGRVDRQTLLAMVGAVLVAIAGDSLHLLSTRVGDSGGGLGRNSLEIAGAVLIAIASAFLTIGVISALIDGVRIRRAVINPPKTMRELLGEGAVTPSPTVPSSSSNPSALTPSQREGGPTGR